MRRQAPIIAGAVAIVFAVLAVLLLVLPKMREVGQVEDQITQAEEEEAALRLQVQQLQAAQEEAPRTRRELAKIQTLVPPTADQPGMIRLLKTAAERSAVDFFSVAPGTPTPDASGEFSVISTNISVTGTFFSMEEFLYRLETLPRAAKVITFSLSPGGQEDRSELSMTLTAELYTTDASAGPGSVPGPSEAGAGA